jgi:hypothetical protein
MLPGRTRRLLHKRKTSPDKVNTKGRASVLKTEVIQGKESSYEIFTAYDSVVSYPDGYPDHPHRKHILYDLRAKDKSRWFE